MKRLPGSLRKRFDSPESRFVAAQMTGAGELLYPALSMKRAGTEMNNADGRRDETTRPPFSNAPMRMLVIGAAVTLLAGCAGDSSRSRTASHRPAAPPINGINSAEFRQCTGRLGTLGAGYTVLPDKSYGGGCTAYGSVRLDRISVPTRNLGPMTCGLAEKFAAWVQYGVMPAARVYFGTEIVRIDSFGTFSCRNIAGSGRLSEHAHSNAVDVASFVLADGRQISLQNDWSGGDEQARAFLRRVRDSACKRFRTVLSPDYNNAHHDHLHFDMGGRGEYCR
jgi:hypothetical protein